ncbi:MAG TPA: hypothetical protein VJ867_01355 [Gemmatimonadaceae bacterium]|nr:hypothetical protein [Gemmatimonadaceae bacterium]
MQRNSVLGGPRFARAGPLSVLGLLLLAGAVPAQQLASTRLATGPFEIALFPTNAAPDARGFARLVYAHSPFGVALTPDGHARYDAEIEVSNLPTPASLGDYRSFVAWAVSSDLTEWHRLGAVTNGRNTVGQAELNKFLLVITAESDSAPAARKGPVILRGTSPSSWLQSFLTHPLFRGVSP